MVSPFYPINHTLNNEPVSQAEAIALFQKDQSMRVYAWVQSGGEFFTEKELEYGKKERSTS